MGRGRSSAQKVLSHLLRGKSVPISDGCCRGRYRGDHPSGHISAMIRPRKEKAIERTVGNRAEGVLRDATILTSSPACLQGLSRMEAMDIAADYFVCELAEGTLGVCGRRSSFTPPPMAASSRCCSSSLSEFETNPLILLRVEIRQQIQRRNISNGFEDSKTSSPTDC